MSRWRSSLSVCRAIYPERVPEGAARRVAARRARGGCLGGGRTGHGPDHPREIADALLDDAETDVRRAVLRSLELVRPAGVHDQVLAMALCDDTEELRDLASRVGPQLP
jgi:hypothetical protein